jgi:hypothetical protein
VGGRRVHRLGGVCAVEGAWLRNGKARMVYRGGGGGVMVACWEDICAGVVGAVDDWKGEDWKGEDGDECEDECENSVTRQREKGT